MLDTLQTLLIALFVLVPGFVADRAYRELVGDSKSDGARQVLNWLVFSVISGAIYAALVSGTHSTSKLPNLPPLEYTDIAWIAPGEEQVLVPSAWFLALGGHVAVAFLGGLILGVIGRRWDAFGLGYRYQTTWDHLITRIAPKRHVLVERTGGRLIVGVLHITNRLTEPVDRDIVIQDPRAFSIEGGLSSLDDQAYLYLPAEEIRSIAFIANEHDLKRRTNNGDRRREGEGQRTRWPFWERWCRAPARRI